MTFEIPMGVEVMEAKLKELGLRGRYIPVCVGEPTRYEIMLKAKRPARVVEGRLKGAEFVLDHDGVKVWTDQKKRAHALASAMQVKVRKLDGEAQFTIPNGTADQFLRGFGVKVRPSRKPMTMEQLNALKERFAVARLKRKQAVHSPVVEGLQQGDTPKA